MHVCAVVDYCETNVVVDVVVVVDATVLDYM